MLATRNVAPVVAPTPLEIPRFVPAAAAVSAEWGAPAFVVTSSAHVPGLDLRAGDVLVVAAEADLEDLVMLVPRRFGRPMLGRLTRRGAVAVPGGVPCDPERWSVAGRLALHVRPEPQGRARVLPFPSEVESQQELPLASGGRGEQGPCVVVHVEGEPTPAVAALVSRRLAGVSREAGGALVGAGGAVGERAPMELAEALSAELWRRFRLSARVVVAPTRLLADEALRRLPQGALAVVTDPDLALAARPVAPAPAPVQLGLWG